MMARRRQDISLIFLACSISSALLCAKAAPQAYHTRFARAQSCPTCPRDCPEKLADGQPTAAKYELAQPVQANQYAYTAHATAATPYVPPCRRSQAKYPEAPPAAYAAPAAAAASYAYPPQYNRPLCNHLYDRSAAASPATGQYDAYDYPGYDYDFKPCRCGRSLDAYDQSYDVHGKYNSRLARVDDDRVQADRQQPLPFADESSPPADFYKNYRPYLRQSRHSQDSDDSEEQPAVGKERERLFVVYRADAFDDQPSERELESVIRHAMGVARQQKSQEKFALDTRKAKAYRYRYDHHNDKLDSKPSTEASLETQPDARFDLSPGPLMNTDSFVSEEGDHTLNPGLDQSKWTIVPSISDSDLSQSADSEAVEEIEAAVSVLPKSKLVKLANVIDKPAAEAVIHKDKTKKEAIELDRPDLPTPTSVTEQTTFDRPIEQAVTSAPGTTDVSPQ